MLGKDMVEYRIGAKKESVLLGLPLWPRTDGNTPLRFSIGAIFLIGFNRRHLSIEYQ
jgi:hypothetical protein